MLVLQPSRPTFGMRGHDYIIPARTVTCPPSTIDDPGAVLSLGCADEHHFKPCVGSECPMPKHGSTTLSHSQRSRYTTEKQNSRWETLSGVGESPDVSGRPARFASADLDHADNVRQPARLLACGGTPI